MPLVLGLGTFFLFMPAIQFDFLYLDDDVYIFQNPFILAGLSWEGIRWAFTAVHAGYWLPLTWLSYMVDVSLFGTEPWGFHFTNLVLHAVNAALVYVVFRRMTGAVAASAVLALLFAVHPLRVESVVWIAERKDVLSGFFWLLAMMAYHRHAMNPRWQSMAVVVVCMALGLLAKPILVVLPVALMLLDVWPLNRWELGRSMSGRGWLRSAAEKIPLFILALLVGMITLATQGGEGAIAQPTGGVERALRLLAVPANVLFYIDKLLWPTHLAALYAPRIPPLVDMVIAAAVLAAVTWAVFRVRQSHPYLFMGWFWFLALLAPVIGILKVGAAVLADRFTYLPSIGAGVMVVWGFAGLIHQRPGGRALLGSAVAVLIAGYAATSWHYQSYWRNNEVFFARILDVNPHVLAHGNFGTYWVEQNDWDRAETHFRAALSLSPSYHEAGVNLAGVLHHRGDLTGAQAILEQVLAVRPHHVTAWNNLGNIFSDLGQYDQAAQRYRRAIDLRPDYMIARYNLGNTYLALNQTDEALATFLEVVRQAPTFAPALQRSAALLFQGGHFEEARAMAKRALALAPDLPEARALIDAMSDGSSTNR